MIAKETDRVNVGWGTAGIEYDHVYELASYLR
jgi:hypothetical protein